MNEIEVRRLGEDAKVIRIVGENGPPVEYGQNLLRHTVRAEENTGTQDMFPKKS